MMRVSSREITVLASASRGPVVLNVRQVDHPPPLGMVGWKSVIGRFDHPVPLAARGIWSSLPREPIWKVMPVVAVLMKKKSVISFATANHDHCVLFPDLRPILQLSESYFHVVNRCVKWKSGSTKSRGCHLARFRRVLPASRERGNRCCVCIGATSTKQD